MSDLMMAL